MYTVCTHVHATHALLHFQTLIVFFYWSIFVTHCTKCFQFISTTVPKFT